MRTTIVVLEDLGRSSRMQAHALALAKSGDVTLVGLEGTPVQAALAAEPRIRSVRLPGDAHGSAAVQLGSRSIAGASSMAARSARLAAALLSGPAPDLLLVRNPPATPTLSVAWLAARLTGARLLVDWHDLSHTPAASGSNEDRRARRMVGRCERRWATHADAHLAASASMAEWLRRECRVEATLLYDRPVACFKKPDLSEAAALWQRLARELSFGPRRVPLVVCATTWQPSEDYDLLLEALERAERRLTAARGATDSSHPSLALLMTGRGPLRAEFEARAARRALAHIAVRSAWLEPAEYPIAIGMADAGICVHQSASGRGLPVQFAEFRGCGVPLCALDYAPVVGEVLRSGHEGVPFSEPGELANVLVALGTGDLSSVPAFAAAREWLVTHPPERWEEAWERIAAPVFEGLSLSP